VRVPRPLTKKEAQKEFLALLEGIVRDLPSHPENPNIRTPHTFIPLAPLAKFVRRKIEPFVRTVSCSLFTFYWSFSPGNSGMVQINAIRLPNGDRVFWFLNDWHDWDEQHFVAGVATKEVSDLEFLRLLFKRNGKDFGHEMFGAPPQQIVTSLKDEPELSDLFLSAYQASPTAWDCLLEDPPDCGEVDPEDVPATELVSRHLREVIR
jgi:hypothetical protein